MHLSHVTHHRSARQHAPDAGFTLVEVLVSVIVIAIGLLGIAKLEALAFSNTGVSSLRSLAAIEASSLAAVMHGDRVFWGTANPTNPCTVASPCTVAETGTTPAITFGTVGSLTSPTVCTTASTTPAACSPTVLAEYDFFQWGTALSSVLPNASASVTCTTTTPVECQIVITWEESRSAAVGTTRTSSGGAASMNTPQYVVFVQP
jgi:type IV pilus assembly protein PilV